MIFLSFLQHSQARLAQFDESYLRLKASILVPGFNEGRVIESSIKSLLQLDYPNYEIIIIDDGSTDDTLEKARKWEGRRGRVRVRVLTQRNAGKAAALNHGLSVARGDVVVCMDSDSKLSRNTLRMGMRYFIDDRIGAVAGNVKVFNRDNLLLKLQALEYIQGLNFVRRAQAYIKAVNIVPGPIGLFRRKTLLEVGGWDSDTFAEDCDLTLKVLTAGWWIDYEPEAISYTEAPEKLLQLLKQRYRWTRGILQSMRKHKAYLVNPAAGWKVILTMWQMIFEAVLWPLMNVLAQALFLFVALMFGMSHLIVLWWVQLTMLDTIAALHSIAIEREKLYLAPLAFIYRVFFIQNIDVAKLIATIEELLGVKMGWGKLERKGKI
ncbi:MAG: glycosyltransferase family 2 protein [Calditrichaeota bacterium]|nr:glycosyltransferase family 2 protein [Calditrichota bacterium]